MFSALNDFVKRREIYKWLSYFPADDMWKELLLDSVLDNEGISI